MRMKHNGGKEEKEGKVMWKRRRCKLDWVMKSLQATLFSVPGNETGVCCQQYKVRAALWARQDEWIKYMDNFPKHMCLISHNAKWR